MPLIHKTNVGHDTVLGIYEFDYKDKDIENVGYSVLPTPIHKLTKSRNRSRQEETIAVYSLLREITGNDNLIICHEDSGRPFLTDAKATAHKQPNIGISHTCGFAAIIMSTEHRVAVDIEYISDRIKKIAKRFLREDEKKCLNTLSNHNKRKDAEYMYFLLVYWCAKETVYKYYSDPRLTFEYIKVEPQSLNQHTGIATCTNMYTGEKKAVNYIITDKYVITYCL